MVYTTSLILELRWNCQDKRSHFCLFIQNLLCTVHIKIFVESYLPFYIHYNRLWHWYPLYHKSIRYTCIYMQLKDMLIDVLLCGLFQFMTLEQWLEYGLALMQLCFYLLKIALLNAKEKPFFSAWVKFPVFSWMVCRFIHLKLTERKFNKLLL